MNIKKDILWRVVVSIIMLTLFGSAILYSAIRVQFVEGEKWRAKGDSLHVKFQTIPSVRGSIYSDDGSLLATSVPIYKLSLDFKVIHKYHSDSFGRYKNQLAGLLAATLQNRSKPEYLQLLEEGYRGRKQYVTIVRNANYLQAKDVQNWPIFHAGRYKGGVIVEERTIRKKPYFGLMHRTIGHINENHKGAGIEASFDDVLSGVNGEIVVRRIPGGYRPLENDIKINPQNGRDIFTTVDIHLQDIVNEKLASGILENDAAYGTAVLLEVKTGKIKAIANLNNHEGELHEYFNHAIGTGYEPGSTIKLVSALAALENGDAEPEDSIDVYYGKYKFFQNDSIEDSGHKRYKRLTYQQVFEKSSNVGISLTAYRGFRKDPKDFIEYFDRLHLTQPIQTGINGEVVPTILRPGNPGWSGMSIPSISIGYSLSMSPLHVAMLYNAMANNGVMMRPYLIEGVGYFGKIEEQYEPEVLEDRICKSSTLKQLQSMLEGVVIRGTGTKLKELSFPVAGKTGTARISTGSGGYNENQYNSSFVGYFPADKPEYTLIVVISNPSKGRFYGSSVALPVFKEIAKNVYATAVQKTLQPADTTQLPLVLSGLGKAVKTTCKRLDLDHDFKARNNEIITLKPVNGTLQGSTISITENTMPDVKGLGLQHCLYLFENQGFKVKARGYGKVVEQSPLPGIKLEPNRTIYLRLSTKS
ncbi:MAG: transpeptidase family protein [Bacteroidia bacterium]|nr:transpeptidase family protein [Bacteroidia bacterium]